MTGAKKIKIGIIGTGPVGMIMAVKLKEAGCDVSICVRNKIKLNRIKTEGIKLEGVFNSTTRFEKIHGSIAEMKEDNCDFLVFALKSYQIKSAAEEARELNTENITIVSAQNGIDVEELLVPTFGSSKVLRMIINYAGNVSSPNVCKVTFFTPPNYIGSIDDSINEKAKEFADALNSVELKTLPVESFELIKRSWEKTILNSSLSALCGVGRLTMAEAMADEDTKELIEQIINEAVIVANAEMIHFPDDFIRKCIRYLKKGGDHFPSLAGDLINNRQTEIDYFNGKIVEYGKKHYKRTSLNLAFSNMVKAMTNKNVSSRIPGAAGRENKVIIERGKVKDKNSAVVYKGGECFLGVDLGSAYIKFTVVDDQKNVVFRHMLETLNKNRLEHKHVMQAINADFRIKYTCATGYGRKHFIESDMVKTEINSAAAGVSRYYPGDKNIIDIGGEDIKIIRCDDNNAVANFSMNDKCASGTGSFLSEIAERAEINLSEMSHLAAQSTYDQELNSFCTVFAKTEIMKWIFDGMSIDDIARGIYYSIANRVAKMKLDPGIPTIMIGGVVAHHPFLQTLLEEKFSMDIEINSNPQFTVSEGAALLAYRQYARSNSLESEVKVKESISS
jgi:(R)-2-hydroxyacyl-CoA dehydratese activating ATPase